jgi:hypothetical protein
MKKFCLFILVVILNDGCSTLLPDAVTTTDNGRFWAFVQIPKNVENPAELRLWATLPPKHRGQEVSVDEIYPKPYEIVEDGQTGNRTIFWRITDFKDKDKIYFYYDFTFTRSEVVTDIDPSNIGSYDTTSVEYQKYTKSEPWIELTSEIKSKALEVVGGETNPYLKARAIFDWVIKNMYYEYPDVKERGAENSFKRLKGDCGEFSVIFSAMCRSVGIPARTITCVWLDEPGHQWAEVYFPEYGWMPVDPSMAQVFAGNSSITQSKFFIYLMAEAIGMPTMDYNYLFGNLYTERLIVSIGNNIEVNHPGLGIARTFHFMQPGGMFSYPLSVEAAGLPLKTAFSQVYVFGKNASDKKYAKREASDYKGMIVADPHMKSSNVPWRPY